MKKYKSIKSIRGIFFMLFLLLVQGCNKDNSTGDNTWTSIGLVVGEAGIADKTFNQSAWEGIQKAASEVALAYQYRVGITVADYPGLINELVTMECQLVVAPGYDKTEAMSEASMAYPATNFLLIDGVAEPIPTNLLCVGFQFDQASFLAGFLAAYWSYAQDSTQPMAAYVAGPQVEEIEQIRIGYMNGINHFNTLYSLNITVAGGHVSNFVDTIAAAELANSLIAQGAQIIFAFAGEAGNAALYQAKLGGIKAIGVDADQYYTYPEVGDILLTSCLKRVDNMTYDQVIARTTGAFHGGRVVTGNLENKGVGLAPFHDFETQIPDSIKLTIENIREEIINGTIVTGWP